MTIPVVHLDIETRSTVDIKRGVYQYATGAQVILWQWAVDDGEVVIEEGPWVRTRNISTDLHDGFRTLFRGAGTAVAMGRFL
jgi:hypothetical protein